MRIRDADVALALCALLAAQYASGPFLRASYAPRVAASALVLATEAVKAPLAVMSLGRAGTRALARARTSSFALAACAPGAVYAAQNVLLARGAAVLDGVSFNCLNQTKLASAAAFLYALRGTRQSAAQMVALGMVLVAGVALSASEGDGVDGRGAADAGARATGAACVLAASALSGLSGALCQIVLQGSDVAPAALTLAMALTGMPMVILAEWVSRGSFPLRSMFETWTSWAWIPALSGAIGGLLVGEITKRLGSIAKGFAVVCGLVLTGLVQSAMDGRRPPALHVVCLVVIVFATYLHSTNPPSKPKKETASKRKKA